MSRAGFTYLMRRADGLFKIGFSANPEKRRVAIQSNVGMPVEIIHLAEFDDARTNEKVAHADYKDKRVYGEWFRFEDHEIAGVRASLEADGNPFPNFRRALRESPKAQAGASTATYSRYCRGEIPKDFEWWLEYPDMLAALLEDARAMTPAEWAKYRRAIKRRSKAAKTKREVDKAKQSKENTP